jgi:hypothetical protein
MSSADCWFIHLLLWLHWLKMNREALDNKARTNFEDFTETLAALPIPKLTAS